MQKIILLAPTLFAACSTAPAAPVVHGETPGHTCQETGTEAYIGQPRSDETGEAIKRATKAAVLRWAPPNVMLTMDYRADRATAWLGPDDRISKIRCG
jgi:Peptidase inhibitor I78 family